MTDRFEVVWANPHPQRQTFETKEDADRFAKVLRDRHDYDVQVRGLLTAQERASLADARAKHRSGYAPDDPEQYRKHRRHRHAHANPSHHVGPCDLACRQGAVEHAHRIPGKAGEYSR